MKEKIVLIDGHSILNRAFYGVPDFTNSEGLHTNAVYGFLNILFKILDEEKPQYLAVAFDLSAPTFRHKMFTEYKGTRKPTPTELKQQVPIIKEMLTAMNINIVELEGYEADDVLGTLARKGEENNLLVSVVSGDRDLLQLATENVKIRIPKTKKGVTEIEDYNANDVLEKYHVTPTQFIDVKALMGDSSDNIPGVPGIGEKGATNLISEYGSIEEAYSHVDEIKNNRNREALRENYDMAQMSKELATIDTNSPVTKEPLDCQLEEMFTEDALAMVKKLEFKSMLPRFLDVTTTNTCEEKFVCINDFGKVEEVFLNAAKAENTGLFFNWVNGNIFGISIAYSEEDVVYIPVSGFVTQSYLEEKIADLTKKAKSLTVLNIKEYQNILKSDESLSVFDAGIAAYLMNPLKDTYDCDDLARDYLDFEAPSFTEIFAKMKLEKIEEAEADKVLTWVCYNSYVLYKVKPVLSEQLKQNDMLDLYNDIELPLIYALYDMEQAGIKVEKDELKTYGDKLSEGIIRIESEIYTEVGEEFNINSPKQLGIILFEKLGLPGGKKTKTGYSTAADVLEKLVADYPIVAKILEYRQLTKLKSTYADGLAQYIGEDGRIHGRFNQTITATGRISSTEPNLQNIPVRMELGREIRKVFVPEKDYVFIDADYSQIELRILASMSDDENLINAYKGTQDIHQITAAKVFHIPVEEVTKEQRNNAKAVNFGIVYGISSFGLSQDLSISRKEAEKYIKEYFVTYPKVKQFLDDTVTFAKENGYALTLFGRKRPIPELSSGNFMQRSFGERAAMNSPIQGTAADIMKIAAINVNRQLKKQNLKSRIVLQVHDELLVETHQDEIEAVKEILSTNMKNAAQLKVDLEIGLDIGNSWFEAH